MQPTTKEFREAHRLRINKATWQPTIVPRGQAYGAARAAHAAHGAPCACSPHTLFGHPVRPLSDTGKIRVYCKIMVKGRSWQTPFIMRLRLRVSIYDKIMAKGSNIGKRPFTIQKVQLVTGLLQVWQQFRALTKVTLDSCWSFSLKGFDKNKSILGRYGDTGLFGHAETEATIGCFNGQIVLKDKDQSDLKTQQYELPVSCGAAFFTRSLDHWRVLRARGVFP